MHCTHQNNFKDAKNDGIELCLTDSHVDITLQRPDYKILRRLKTDKIIKAVLWESFAQTKILKGLWRIDCL